MNPQKQRVQAAFSGADDYDSAASVQSEAASRLARKMVDRLPGAPARILEIGCGTGLLSRQLATAFPASHLTLTDISPAMLERCQTRLGPGATYSVMDGEVPNGIEGPFGLIASSLAMQWFTDLPGSIGRLSRLLATGGRLIFATLGAQSFQEWRQAHADFGLPCGLHDYPSLEDFPLPPGVTARIESETITERYPSAQAFAHALKTLGAGTPRPGYRPLQTSAFRQLLRKLDGHFTVSHQILYVDIEQAQGG